MMPADEYLDDKMPKHGDYRLATKSPVSSEHSSCSSERSFDLEKGIRELNIEENSPALSTNQRGEKDSEQEVGKAPEEATCVQERPKSDKSLSDREKDRQSDKSSKEGEEEEENLVINNSRGDGEVQENGKARHVETSGSRAIAGGALYLNEHAGLFNNPLQGNHVPPFQHFSVSMPAAMPPGLLAAATAAPQAPRPFSRRRQLSEETPPCAIQEHTLTLSDFEQKFSINVLVGSKALQTEPRNESCQELTITGNNILHKAALEKNLALFKRSLAYSRRHGLSHALDAQNALGQTPLLIWAYQGCKEGIMATMAAEPNPNIRGRFARVGSRGAFFRTRWMSPLAVIAASKRKELVVSFLRQARLNAKEKPHLRLDVDQLDSVGSKQKCSGFSALAQCVMTADPSVVPICKVLISYGAKPFLKMSNETHVDVDALLLALKKGGLLFFEAVIETLLSEQRTAELQQLNEEVAVQFSKEEPEVQGSYLDLFNHAVSAHSDRHDPKVVARVRALLEQVEARPSLHTLVALDSPPGSHGSAHYTDGSSPSFWAGSPESPVEHPEQHEGPVMSLRVEGVNEAIRVTCEPCSVMDELLNIDSSLQSCPFGPVDPSYSYAGASFK